MASSSLSPDDLAKALYSVASARQEESEEESNLGSNVGGVSVRTLWWNRSPRQNSRFKAGILAAGFLMAMVVVALVASRSLRTSARASEVAKRGEQLLEVSKSHKGTDASNITKGDIENSEKEFVPDQGMGWPNGTYWPTLFCWSVVNADNQEEVNLVKAQLRMRIGIFQCDNAAVLSGRSLYLGEGHKFKNGTAVKVFTWVNPARPVPKGSYEAGDNTISFKNTRIFIDAWNILISSNALWGHNWTVKVDPDAVLFPERLRWHLKNYTYGNKPMHFKNCDYHGLAALYGSLEVFNEAAMYAYRDGHQKCAHLPADQWGEDQWIDTCMWQQLGSAPQNDYTLVGDRRCMAAECEDTWRAAFHDYKSEWSYIDCWKRSTNAQRLKDDGDFCCLSSWNKADPCNSCATGQTQYPGSGWCADSWENCHKCGGQTSWCRTGKDGKHMLAQNGR